MYIAKKFELPYYKTNKMTVHPTKTLIKLGIRPVWSVFAVCMKKAWVLSNPLSASEDSWDCVDAQPDLSLRWAHSHFVGFVIKRLIWLPCWELFDLGLADCNVFPAYLKNSATCQNCCNYLKMSRLMTKPTKWVWAQRRLSSAWASAQSDQSSLCVRWVAKDPSFFHADMPRLIWVFAGSTATLLALSWGSSNEQRVLPLSNASKKCRWNGKQCRTEQSDLGLHCLPRPVCPKTYVLWNTKFN